MNKLKHFQSKTVFDSPDEMIHQWQYKIELILRHIFKNILLLID